MPQALFVVADDEFIPKIQSLSGSRLEIDIFFRTIFH